VLQVAIPYGVGAWLLVQIAEVILDAFQAPPWAMQGLLVVLVLGFPIAVVLAWVFDISPEHHLVRTDPLPDQGSEEPVEETPEPQVAPAMSLEMGTSQRRQVTMLSAAFDMAHGDDPEADPEYQRETVTALQELYRDVAERYEAYQLPGGVEELTLVFGYPQAREDDARRAVAAGLALIDASRSLTASGTDQGAVLPLARVGISTSLVVVEETSNSVGGTAFIGQAPRMAAWLQGLAAPSTVIVGPHTRKLVASHFQLDAAGTHSKTQFGDQVEVFLVESAVSLEGALETVVPLQGRDDEMHLLQERWENVLDGDGQFVVLQGEPGIGKSSLLSSFVQRVRENSETFVLPCQCSPYERDNPLAPIITLLQRFILGFSEHEPPASRLQKLHDFAGRQPTDSEKAIPLLASLLSLDPGTGYEPPSGSPQNIRTQTMELLLDLTCLAASRNPLLLVIEDLHWADPSTLEMVQKMVDRGPAPGLFVLFTARPAFQADWSNRSYVLVHDVVPLSRRAARTLIEATAEGLELPNALVKRIIEETDGNPLFIQELTLAVLESDTWRESKAAGRLEEISWLEIPATLKDSLTARVDNLGEAKSLLQLCSVLGNEFSYELLRSVSGTANEAALKQELGEIVAAEMLYQRGALKNLSYRFKHILIQETAYDSLLMSKRRELHGRTAEILEQELASTTPHQPALLAYHYTEAGMAEKAIPYWTLASRQSLASFANQEAIEQARRGIQLLESLPESPQRAAQELPLQSVLGTALLSIHGYVDPQVRHAFTRAQDLCEQIGDAPQLFQVVVGLWMFNLIASKLDEALEQAQRLLRIAETTDNPAHHLQARYCQAFVQYYRGEFLSAKTHLETALRSEVPDCDYVAQSASGDDTRLHVRVLLAVVNWHLGYLRTAARLVEEANVIAREAGHPWGRTFAAFYSAWFHQMRGDAGRTLAYANEAAAIAEEKGFRFWLPLVGYMRAWAGNRDAADVGRPLEPEAAQTMQQCLDAYRGIGAGAGVTYLSFKLAEDYVALSMQEAAGTVLEDGWAALRSSGEICFEPEYYRLKSRLCLARHANAENGELLEEASKLIRLALSAAQRIESKGLELRAAIDRADFLSRSGEHVEAARLLDGILQRFDEPDDSEDCVRARELVETLKNMSQRPE